MFILVILNPEVFSNTVYANPPGDPSTFLKTTVSLEDLPWLGSVTVTTADPEVKLKGFPGNKLGVEGSTLSGLAWTKPWGSPPWGLGSNWGCFGSYSEVWTLEPFHSTTISEYGKAWPERSEINCAYFPLAKLDIWIISFWGYVRAWRRTVFLQCSIQFVFI